MTPPNAPGGHLNFFQHKTFLHARQPRVQCPDYGVKTVVMRDRGLLKKSPVGATTLLGAIDLSSSFHTGRAHHDA